mgnify:CR=1 FL=1
MRHRVLVTGVAKAGKSTVLNILSALGYRAVDLAGELVRRVSLRWSSEYGSYEFVNPEEAYEAANSIVDSCSGPCAFETVAYSIVNPGLIDLVIVVRRNPIELYREYSAYNWPCLKVFNNIVSEVTGSHVAEIRSMFSQVVEVLYSADLGVLRRRVEEALMGVDNPIDWIRLIGGSEELHRILLKVEGCLNH